MSAARERIMAKYQTELDAWWLAERNRPALPDGEFEAVQRANWLDGVRRFDPDASLDEKEIPVSDIQAEFDRAAAEYGRLVDTPLPNDWLERCPMAAFPGLPHGMSLEEAERRVRVVVNTVLPGDISGTMQTDSPGVLVRQVKARRERRE